MTPTSTMEVSHTSAAAVLKTPSTSSTAASCGGAADRGQVAIFVHTGLMRQAMQRGTAAQTRSDRVGAAAAAAPKEAASRAPKEAASRTPPLQRVSLRLGGAGATSYPGAVNDCREGTEWHLGDVPQGGVHGGQDLGPVLLHRRLPQGRGV